MKLRRLVPLAVVPLLALTGCGLDNGSSTGKDGHAKVVIVGQKFTEADVMSSLYKELLDKAGFDASVKSLGARDVYLEPLIKGDVQVSTDYLSSMTEALNRKAHGDNAPTVASPDPDKTLAELEKLGKKYGLTPLRPAQAQDANAFAVTQQYRNNHALKTLSDLGKTGLPIKLGAASDCPQRPDCKVGLEKVYGIKITGVEPTGFDSAATKDDLKKGRTQLALVATTDASLDDMGIIILDDDKHLQNAENLLPIVNTKWLKANPKAEAALDKLADVLTTQDLSDMIGFVEEERQQPDQVAHDYLSKKGLL